MQPEFSRSQSGREASASEAADLSHSASLQDRAQVESQVVREQLQRILEADEFTASERMTGFLRFVVNEVLDGRAGQIKQYTIATKVFERDRDFDQQNDPIVRVQAAKVRRALQRYYLEEGRDDPVRLTIPKGTYVPQFVLNADATPPDAHLATPRPPTVAVVPFVNGTGETSHDFLANGFAEDLSTELSRFQGIAVVAFYATQQLQMSERDVCRIGKQLQADFLVTGSLRQVKPELRVNAQVFSTSNGTQIWAGRFHRGWTAAELYDVQEEILRSLTAQIAGTYGAIGNATARSSRRKDLASLSCYEAVLRALHFDKTMAADDFQNALAALQRAVEADPEYAPALARLAILELDSYGFGFDLEHADLDSAVEYAQRAVALDPNSQDAQFAMTWANLLRGDAESARRSAWKMIELNPGDASLVGTGGWFLALAGERAKGLEVIDRCRKLNPNCPSWFHLISVLEELDQGHDLEALHRANQIGLPDFFWDSLLKAAVLGRLGRSEEAIREYARLIDLRPDSGRRAEFYIGNLVLSPESRSRILAGLAVARPSAE